MELRLQKTETIVTIDGVLARIWDGTTDRGVACRAFVIRIAVAGDQDAAQFESDLAAAAAPASRGVQLAMPFTDGDALESASAGDLLAAVVSEIETLRAAGHTLPIVLEPLEAVQLAGLLQLTLRHPDLTTELSTTALELTQQIAEWFEPCPAVSLVIRRGFDPEHDR